MSKECEYIKVSSRTGHFNFTNPSEESVSTHIVIHNPDGTTKMFCNIRTEYELFDNGCQTIAGEIRHYLKSIYHSTDQKNIETMYQYILKNEDALCIGNWQHELKQIWMKRDKLNEQINLLEKRIGGYGYFEKGVWIDYNVGMIHPLSHSSGRIEVM